MDEAFITKLTAAEKRFYKDFEKAIRGDRKAAEAICYSQEQVESILRDARRWRNTSSRNKITGLRNRRFDPNDYILERAGIENFEDALIAYIDKERGHG